MSLEPCPGCGLALAPVDGPTHPYIGASPACWSLFGEVLAREFNDVRYGRLHGTTVDAYAVQHPGVPEPRTIRSVALHSIRLLLVVEQGKPQPTATEVMARVARSTLPFDWLEPPRPNGRVTVRDVSAASDPEEHVRAVESWAADLWSAWSGHHDRIRTWLEQALASPRP